MFISFHPDNKLTVRIQVLSSGNGYVLKIREEETINDIAIFLETIEDIKDIANQINEALLGVIN